MSNVNVATTVQDELNRCMPAAKYARLGDLMVHLIDNVNALRVAHAALVAKLDTAGATVTGLGTNYVATCTATSTVPSNNGNAITAITTLENR